MARLAGVSPTTVSLVLSGKGARISKATQAKVHAAVESLGYRPNRTAQGLRRGESSTIGFITDQIAAQPFSGPIVSGAHDVVFERGKMLLMVNTTLAAKRIERAIENLLDQQVDAIMFATIGTREIRLPAGIHRVPSILVNAVARDHDLPSVIPDEWAGGRAIADHVLGLGHRRVAMLAGVRAAWATGVRVKALRQALLAHGLRPDAARVLYGNYRFDTGYDLARAVMTGPRPPTALICGNDQMAAGAYLALARLGLSVPDDVSVVGYDDEPLAELLEPKLTTVKLPFYDLGRQGIEMLLAASGPLPPRTHTLATPLVVRSSSAAPAA